MDGLGSTAVMEAAPKTMEAPDRMDLDHDHKPAGAWEHDGKAGVTNDSAMAVVAIWKNPKLAPIIEQVARDYNRV